MRQVLRTVCAAFVLGVAASAGADDLAARIRVETQAIEQELIRTRRAFHQHPELSNREVETGREIARRLRALGLSVRAPVAGTGVVAELAGALPGPLVAWRADIDALPIEERVDVPYRSASPGVMHACGHDVHITVGLGAAEVLSRLRDRLAGRVRFIFQPAEEGPPAGEPGGAPLMIAEGVLADPVPAAIFGLHVMPTRRAGEVGVRSGGIMAAADRFTIRVHGRATHGSTPHDGIDTVWVAAQVVTALQGVVSRENDARRPLVVSVGSLHAGNRFNIVAGEAVLEGTVRTLDEATHAAARERISRVLDGVCKAHRATCELDYEEINPVTNNPAPLAVPSFEALRRGLGAGAVQDAEPIMAAEDFAHYGRHVPAFYFFLGVGNPEKGLTSYVHTATFQPDEAAIATGVEAACLLLTGAVELPAPKASR
ncbi:MAG: amidohydrolase [Acidobacteria bacterium]|nr:amidohydrolase [Acidobacteriota bacterium]